MNKINIKEDGGAGAGGSAVPANAMGGSSSTAGTGGIDTYDPLMSRMMQKRKPPKGLRQIIGHELKLDKRSDRQ